MGFDKEDHDKIIETAQDVKHILERLEEGKETFKEHRGKFKEQNKRIGKLEKEQQLLVGKMAVILIGIGAAVTLVFNFLLWIWSFSKR